MQEHPAVPLKSIAFGERGRSEYTNIESLADDIAEVGLILPVIIRSTPDSEVPYKLIAGGRRLTALLRNAENGGPDFLTHGKTGDPLAPGYLFVGESTPLKDLMMEISENLHRENLPWRDEVALIVKAFWQAKAASYEQGTNHTMRDIGKVLGVAYGDVLAATRVMDDMKECEEAYKDCQSLRSAYTVCIKRNADALAKLAADKLLEAPPTVAATTEPGLEQPTAPAAKPLINFSSFFFRACGLAYMQQLINENKLVDHIVTDPDYAIAVERLEVGTKNAAEGIAQKTVQESLDDLHKFLRLAWHVTKPHAFCVFFYDLEHHEKLLAWSEQIGWSVQRWPLLWHKTDYMSNTAINHNFPKNEEYAMVLRKPSATLTKPQRTSVFQCASGNTATTFGHPFAKPEALWHWIYDAVCLRGQTVLDPFMGSGSGPSAALSFGLRPIGTEVQENLFAKAVGNIKRAYEKRLGPCDFI